MSNVLKVTRNYGAILRSRSLRIFVFTWAILVSILISTNGIPTVFNLITALTLGFTLGAYAYIFNDILDVEMDRISNVQRPLAQKKSSNKEYISLSVLLVGIAIVTSLIVNVQTFILTLTYLGLATIYSTPKIYLKGKLFVKQMIPAIGGALITMMGGTIVSGGMIPASILYATLFFFIFIFAGSPIADLSDMKGDRMKKIRTIAIVYGTDFAIKMSMILFLSLAVITILTYPILGLNIVAPVVLTIAMLFGSWVVFKLRTKVHDPIECLKVEKRLALSLFIGQFALIIGAI